MTALKGRNEESYLGSFPSWGLKEESLLGVLVKTTLL